MAGAGHSTGGSASSGSSAAAAAAAAAAMAPLNWNSRRQFSLNNYMPGKCNDSRLCSFCVLGPKVWAQLTQRTCAEEKPGHGRSRVNTDSYFAGPAS